MKLVIATPFYPPDTEVTAVYAYELAKRLSSRHSVVVVTYGRLPEELPNITVNAVEKRHGRLSRVVAFRNSLSRALRGADALILVNGMSVEAPLACIPHARRIPTARILVDEPAESRANRSVLAKMVKRVLSYSHVLNTNLPLPRPEILPLAPYPEIEFHTYEQSWESHIATLKQVLSLHD